MRIKALSKKLNLPVAEIGRILQLNSSENTLVNLKLTDEEVLKVLQSLGKTLEDLDKLVEEIEDEITVVEEIVTENRIIEETPKTEVAQQEEEEPKNNAEQVMEEPKKVEVNLIF